ncbi:cyclophilin-like fold protein [Georgenia sp. MJ173]|uniref:cyclophilin-like fold protein n=1 Tax=Georgenia sunbinii TaxID=3117728 RepID=UPI002F2645F3
MRIELTIGEARIDGELFDHPVAHEFARMLPLSLAFNDFNQVEKVAPLDRSLPLTGVPHADAPEPGEIGYHAPTRGLVLYYGRPGRWPGLVRMGRFTYDLDALRDLPDGSPIQITAAPTRAY